MIGRIVFLNLCNHCKHCSQSLKSPGTNRHFLMQLNSARLSFFFMVFLRPLESVMVTSLYPTRPEMTTRCFLVFFLPLCTKVRSWMEL